MTAEKQGKAYGVLMFFVVVLLLAAQGGLQYIFKQSSAELGQVSTELATEERNLNSQRSLSDKYKSFQMLAQGYTGTDRQFPVNGRELFTALSQVLTDYQIVHQNLTSTAGVQPGANFTLQITFNGQYYDVMKALAAIRESNYIMRISEIQFKALGGGVVSGVMSIISTAQAQG